MDALVFMAVLALAMNGVEILLIILFRLIHERNHPSYLLFKEDRSACAYIYETVHRLRGGTISRYFEYRYVQKNGKWRKPNKKINTKVDVVVSIVLLICVVFYLVVMLGGELWRSWYIILIFVMILTLFYWPILFAEHVIPYITFMKLLRKGE